MVEISQALLDDLARATSRVIKSYMMYPLNQELIDASAGAGTKTFDFDAVGSRRIAIVFSISAIDETSSPTKVKLGLNDGVSDFWHKTKASPTAAETTSYIGQLVLGEGDFIRATFEGVTSGDSLLAFMNGYWFEL